MDSKHRARPLFDGPIMRQALLDAVRKLNPRAQFRNPVMFVVEVGAALTTLLLVADMASGQTTALLFNAQIALWLWFTVFFANFAEAMAEGRGKAQAASLRRARTQMMARRLAGGIAGREERVTAGRTQAWGPGRL